MHKLINPLDVIVEHGPESGNFYVVAYFPDDKARYVHDHIFEHESSAVILASKAITRGYIDTNHWAQVLPTHEGEFGIFNERNDEMLAGPFNTEQDAECYLAESGMDRELGVEYYIALTEV